MKNDHSLEFLVSQLLMAPTEREKIKLQLHSMALYKKAIMNLLLVAMLQIGHKFSSYACEVQSFFFFQNFNMLPLR